MSDAPAGGSAPGRVDLSHATLTPAQWAAADIPVSTYAVGALVGRDVRMMLVGGTGAGKTMFALALSVAAYLGRGFLHWTGGKPLRVLYVDGEMPKAQMQTRIKAAFEWFGEDWKDHADGFYVLSREDFETLPPLDTGEGQTWFDDVFAQLRPDFVHFDNLMSLTAKSLKEDEQWQTLKGWLLRLRFGWSLLHHTGHDQDRAYGDKAREWHMDTVALLKPIKDAVGDVAFELNFTKCRRRTPTNRADFETRRIELLDGEWTSGAPARTPEKKCALTPTAQVCFQALVMAIDREGQPVPLGTDVPTSGARGVPELTWRRFYQAKRPVDEDDKRARDTRSKAFRDSRDRIEAAGLAASSVNGWWWLTKGRGE